MKHLFNTYLLLLLFLVAVASCKNDEQKPEPDAKEFLIGKWEVSMTRSFNPQSFQVEFHQGGTASWNAVTFNGNPLKTYWVYEVDGQKLSLHNPDRNFVILEQSADELVVKETDTGIYYAFKRLN